MGQGKFSCVFVFLLKKENFLDYPSVINNSWKLFFYLALIFLLSILGMLVALNGAKGPSGGLYLIELAGICIVQVVVSAVAHRGQAKFVSTSIQEQEDVTEVLLLLTQSPKYSVGTLRQYEEEGKPVLEVLQRINDDFGAETWLDVYERFLRKSHADIGREIANNIRVHQKTNAKNFLPVDNRQQIIENLPSWKFFEKRRLERFIISCEEDVF